MKCSLVKKGDKWYVTYNEKLDNGKYKKVWISTGEDKKTKAQDKLTEIQHQINNGIYVKKDKMTIKDLLNLWMEIYVETNLEKTTYNGYKTIINKYIVPYFKDSEIQKMSPLDIEKYYKYLQKECISIKNKKGLSQNTVHRHHAILSKAFNFAVVKQFLVRNICDAVELPKRQKFRAEVYSDDEVKELISKIEGTDIEILVHLAVGLGLRLSEICGLTWKNVDFKKSFILVNSARVRDTEGTMIKKTKTDSSTRSIKVPKPLIDLLQKTKTHQAELKSLQNSWLLETDFVVIREDGKVLHPSTLSHKFSEFLSENGLKRIRLHDLRHTNITLLLKNKVDYKVVQRRGGWSNMKTMFDTYAHVLEEMEQEADIKIENAIYN